MMYGAAGSSCVITHPVIGLSYGLPNQPKLHTSGVGRHCATGRSGSYALAETVLYRLPL